MRSIRTLLTSAIDYAGLFPPASLSMREAATNYATYLRSSDTWALGRFVVAARGLPDLGAALRTLDLTTPWRITAVGTSDLPREGDLIAAFNAAWDGKAVVDSVEFKGETPGHIDGFLAQVSGALQRYVEIPLTADPEPLLDALARNGAAAKIRTGGVTPQLFPDTDHLLRFLTTAVQRGIPFKATAGLHHPVRGAFPLTYATDSAVHMMYGYLNIFAATALLRAGASPADARLALLETDRAAFDLRGDRLRWTTWELDADLLRGMREGGLHSFGSCSFREPLDELGTLIGTG